MRTIFFIVTIMFVFLFVGGPNYESHRIYKELWDLGHIFLFASIAYIITNSTFFKKNSNIKYFFTLITLCAALGLAIEVLQVFIGRNFELKDLVADVLGAAIGFAIANYINAKYIFNKRYLSIISIVLISLISSRNLISVTTDEIYMRSEFPNLASYSNSFSLSRWDVNKAQISRSERNSETGTQLLSVNFLPAKYPDITLQHFVRNWNGYNFITFKVFNAQKKNINVEFKIYDRIHIENGYTYSDRFNMKLNLKAGWNNIKVSLTKVINAPKDREMDITSIKSISLFLIDVKKPVNIYLSDIKLK